MTTSVFNIKYFFCTECFFPCRIMFPSRIYCLWPFYDFRQFSVFSIFTSHMSSVKFERLQTYVSLNFWHRPCQLYFASVCIIRYPICVLCAHCVYIYMLCRRTFIKSCLLWWPQPYHIYNSYRHFSVASCFVLRALPAS